MRFAHGIFPFLPGKRINVRKRQENVPDGGSKSAGVKGRKIFSQKDEIPQINILYPMFSISRLKSSPLIGKKPFLEGGASRSKTLRNNYCASVSESVSESAERSGSGLPSALLCSRPIRRYSLGVTL